MNAAAAFILATRPVIHVVTKVPTTIAIAGQRVAIAKRIHEQAGEAVARWR
jgi:hypothetical protein